MKEFFEARFQALKEYLSSITEGFSTIGIITEVVDLILVIALIVFIIYCVNYFSEWNQGEAEDKFIIYFGFLYWFDFYSWCEEIFK